MQLRYGTNPDAIASFDDTPALQIRNGQPSLINLLDALNAWQLVRDASRALGRPAAASFKHVSPAGAALAGPLDDVQRATWDVDGDVSDVAAAYIRARDCDPKCSFSDVAAVSGPVDRDLAHLLASVVCDAVIAPAYEQGTLEVLARKQGGRFLVLEIDPTYEPAPEAVRDVFGIRVRQSTEHTPITRDLIVAAAAPPVPAVVVDDLVLAVITARFTQSNSIVCAQEGLAVGIGAGQQSRIDCTRIAGTKADVWALRRHPAITSVQFHDDVPRQSRINWQIRLIEGDLTPREERDLADAIPDGASPLGPAAKAGWLARRPGVSLASDGLIPFADNIDEAARHAVTHIVEPGGSTRTIAVDDAATEHGITLIRTGVRLFHH